MAQEEDCRRLAADLAAAPLLAGRDGGIVLRLGGGAIPRLVAWTHEDKAAKGLRKLAPDAAPRPPIHFTVAEVIQEAPALLLTGEAGSGRTTLARDLALGLARGRLGEAWPGPAPVDRNDLGDALPQAWTGPLPFPVLLAPEPGTGRLDLAAATRGRDGPLLLIIDDLEAAGPDAVAVLADAAALMQERPDTRVLALAGTDVAAGWRLPAGWTRLGLLPLLAAQRRRFVAAHGLTCSPATLNPVAANASLFALALAVPEPADIEEDLVGRWLATQGEAAEAVCRAATEGLSAREAPALPLVARPRRVRQLLAAHGLASAAPRAVSAALERDPVGFAPVVASVLKQAGPERRDVLASALAALAGDTGSRGALLAAATVAPASPAWPAIEAALVAILSQGTLPARLREEAGRILSRHGDPRDLEALASIPGGTFTMGAPEPPNASPPHPVTVASFRIGVFPVTTGQYASFVAATGRLWKSPVRDRPERRSAPATDLTWRDARAYCAWLTGKWRAQGRIGPDEEVRLPTEPEWERAARGDQSGADGAVVYPWGGPWNPDAVNGEETGFNDTCTVGLFLAGRSPYGCLDMAGQVWEWVSTLWGEDMARPAFAYPYRDDGREDAGAGPAVRRGLRGGCFSSGAPKACCTYRGSLEPDGFWRGNGFRIVVAPGAGTAP